MKTRKWVKKKKVLRVTHFKTSCVLTSQFLQTALIVFQETNRESRVERHARGTEMMSGWGSAWPARTELTAKSWWVQGHGATVASPNGLMWTMYAHKSRADYTNIIVANVLPRTALLNHSWSQHYSPQQKSPLLSLCFTCFQSSCTSKKTELKGWFFFFCTFKVRQILDAAVRLRNTVKHLPRVWAWTSQWSRFGQESIVVYEIVRGIWKNRPMSGANPRGAWLGICTEIIGHLAEFV